MNFTEQTPPQHLGGRITVARLREWVRAAQPGARLIYATGPSCRASCGEAVADEVARLGSGAMDKKTGRKTQGLMLVSEHHTKIDGTGTYLIQRTAKPAPRVGL